MAGTKAEELQNRCVSIQGYTKIYDDEWREKFGNDEGLYGFVRSEIVKAKEELLDELEKEAEPFTDDFTYSIAIPLKVIEAKRKQLGEGKR